MGCWRQNWWARWSNTVRSHHLGIDCHLRKPALSRQAGRCSPTRFLQCATMSTFAMTILLTRSANDSKTMESRACKADDARRKTSLRRSWCSWSWQLHRHLASSLLGTVSVSPSFAKVSWSSRKWLSAVRRCVQRNLIADVGSGQRKAHCSLSLVVVNIREHHRVARHRAICPGTRCELS